ncbi:MAG TPA: TonB-dependent receptor [Bryobacteraceae bacterium]|nr:TonB-dependent receptor [Bryobacteraceae bacterium]
MRSLFAAAGLTLLALAVFAQSDRGAITGTIADPAGAVVANAKIEAKNVATSAVYEVASTDTGNYTLAQLPAGTYEMSVTVAGFKRFIRQNLTVQVAGTIRIDVVLEVGATSESVTVTEAAPLLKTESGELSHNVSTDRLNNLPAITLGNAGGLGNIRNPLQAVTLLPGTQFANDNTLRVNGMPSSTYSIRVEGQDATNGIHRQFTQVSQTGLDAIQEVSVQVSNFSAEFGQAGGGYFNYTMKSGTNQFHGSAYDYLVNEALNSPTPFTNDGTGHHIRNRQRRNDYGFTFGGPLAIPKVYDGHDKTFFFFNFEQFRETQRVSTGLDTVPTLDYRQGNFSGALVGRLTIAGQPASDSAGQALFQNQVFNPSTTRTVNGATVRDPYVNNTIPKTDMDPVALKIQAMFPNPVGTRATQAINNYEAPAYDNYRHTTIPSIKLDHNLSSMIKISGFYSQTRAFSPQVNDFQTPFTNSVIQDTKSHTVRVNYDHSVTPTMLLHLGAGLLYTTQPNLTPTFDQTSLGWSKNFAASTLFPWLSIGSDPSRGGMSYVGGIFNPYAYLEDIKPTANASLTWVKGNHTYKMGGEMMFEGFPNLSYSRANGNLGFGAQQTADPWELGRGTNALTGFSYASFLLGRSLSLNHGTGSSNRLGNHSLGLYIQDTWKVTRKFTLDYGLRYDYVTLLKEQYGRMQDAAFSTPNPVAGNRLGSVIYQATCKCSFNHNYPWAFGPRLGAAYQITPKTVFRAGVGLSYGTSPNQAGLSPNVGDFYTVNPVSYGEPATLLQDGNPYGAGNRFGNAPIFWPDFRPNYPSETAPGVRPPQSPFIFVDRNSGRPPRIFQWSIGLQRELSNNLVVEATYVGNRGVWWTSPLLSTYGYNSLTPEGLKSTYGIDTSVQADRALLVTPISSPTVISRFPWLANPNNVYPGFPSGQFLNQALRPYPQWGGVPPFLGPPLGVTWYDSLQAKVTKRISHGLSVDTAFTWQKEQNLGVSSDTSYLTPAPNLINDVFNYKQNKQISAFSRPFMLVITANYTTPGFAAGNAGFKVLSWVARDWTIGTLLRYQSGQVIRTPPSNNAFFTQLNRTQNPATFGGGNTFWNRVSGQPLLNFDPNCKCFDPTTQLVLNPAAWSDAPAGTFGTSAPYYNDYRWQRQPAESLSIGRNFRMRERMNLQIRAEFQNVLNRVFLANPLAVSASSSPFVIGAGAPNPASPTVRVAGTQTLSSGYGFVSTFNGGAAQPRTGQIVARFTF